jgi:hypothetical protein
MEPTYDEATELARGRFGDAYDRECFDYGFHAGWHGGGEPQLGQEGEAWEEGKINGARQRDQDDLR